MRIETIAYAILVPVPCQVDMADLAKRMHPRVGRLGGLYAHLLAAKAPAARPTGREQSIRCPEFASRRRADRHTPRQACNGAWRLAEGFSHFVTSMTAPVASGWSGCRAGLAPTGKRRLFTARATSGLYALQQDIQ